MTLKVALKTVGNPDFGQDPSRPMWGVEDKTVKVRNFEEASRVCRAFIEENEVGGGNWTGGQITDAAGEVVGEVSYNGRVWPPGGYAIGVEPLWPRESKAKKEAKAKAKAADPLEWEKAVIQTKWGPIEITGCFRVGNLTTVPGKFVFDGHRHEIMTNVTFAEDGTAKVREFDLMKDGRFEASVTPTKGMRAAIAAAVADWVSEPENFAMILRNQIKDLKGNIAHKEGNIAFREQEIAKLRDKIAEEQDEIAALEDRIAGLEAGGPKP